MPFELILPRKSSSMGAIGMRTLQLEALLSVDDGIASSFLNRIIGWRRAC
jgi:hypothetical protein